MKVHGKAWNRSAVLQVSEHPADKAPALYDEEAVFIHYLHGCLSPLSSVLCLLIRQGLKLHSCLTLKVGVKADAKQGRYRIKEAAAA